MTGLLPLHLLGCLVMQTLQRFVLWTLRGSISTAMDRMSHPEWRYVAQQDPRPPTQPPACWRKAATTFHATPSFIPNSHGLIKAYG